MEMSCVHYEKKRVMLETGTAEWYTGPSAWTYTLIIQFEFDCNIQYKYEVSKKQVIIFLSFTTHGSTQIKKILFHLQLHFLQSCRFASVSSYNKKTTYYVCNNWRLLLHRPIPQIKLMGFFLYSLTFKSLAVTLRTTRFKIKKFRILITSHLCVLYGSQNKEQLLPYTALTDWFL